MNKQYKTAIYLRLSREDGDGESSSIENQRLMLQAFIAERNDLELVTEYVDDGYSGYAFDRPAFQEMLQAAKSGSIDCIVVKDLSRLGRNFGKTEEYLQRIFPKYHIRFIAVNDCFDSSSEQSAGDRLTKPLINLMNEFHVAETSQKVRAVLEHHRRNGKFIGNHATYGYRISKKSLVVDEEAARIVRMIFRMKIEGSSNQAISDYLKTSVSNLRWNTSSPKGSQRPASISEKRVKKRNGHLSVYTGSLKIRSISVHLRKEKRLLSAIVISAAGSVRFPSNLFLKMHTIR